MIPRRFHICDLFGIPIYLDLSLIVLVIIFVMDAKSFQLGVATALLLLISVTMHELGHSLTARLFGCATKDITLSLLGGCASGVIPHKAWQELLVAIAGPAVSFALSFFGATMYVIGLPMLSQFITVNDFLIVTVLYLTVMNSTLAIFNLLPGFPMDGGRIFRSIVRAFLSREKATYVAMIVGRIVAAGIGLFGVWQIISGGGWGFVSILIGWMIWREGWREYQMAKMEERWTGHFDYKVSPPPFDD